MIATLHIKNIGIIDDLTVNFDQGFNVLTGETGAGKTLIMDSLAIIAGGRFSKEMIRKGEDYSFVELSMYLPNNEAVMDENVIVSREIATNGRNVCKINGRLVTVNELREFMENKIDIHGQCDNQTLLNVATHIKLLDDFAGIKMAGLKAKYQERYTKYKQLQVELEKNYGDDKEKQRKLDLLSYQLKEIQQAGLKIGEDENLEEKRRKLLNSEKIVESLQIANKEINQNTNDSIQNAIRALEKIEGVDTSYDKVLEALRAISYEVEEAGRDLSYLGEEGYFEEAERDQIEERLDQIFSLKRKYGNTIEEIIRYGKEVETQIFEIENLEEYIQELKKKRETLKIEMRKLAEDMHEIRLKSGKVLAEKINKELEDLEMKQAKVEVEIQLLNVDQFNKNGLDEVEFKIQTNVGEEVKPLIKIASGGEMSRMMLAIKTVLADVDEVPILVFDEIDTGISGVAANSVGIKLKKIAQKHQVLCVTHLASIAAKGDYNYYISKEVKKGQTKTQIQTLLEEEVIKEIARIATGEITEVALAHARELRMRV